MNEARDEHPEPMRVTETRKDDGRLLIYYEFEACEHSRASEAMHPQKEDKR